MIAAVGARSGAQPAAGAPSCLQRFLIAGCLALLLGILGAFARLWQTGGMAANKTDFVPYYSVARMVVAGHGRLMYALKPLGSLETTLVRPLHVKDGVMPYLYPPHFAFLLAPLARLPLNLAFAAWLLINLCLLAASLRLLQRSSGVTGWDALVLWLAGCSFFPVLLALAQGQTSILLLALLTVALVSLREGRNELAGVMLAFALIKPPYVLPILIVLVFQRRWRSLVWFAATGLVLLAIPLMLLGSGVLHGYAGTLLQASGWRHQIGGFGPQWNQSLAGFTQLLLPSRIATITTAVLVLAVLIAVARVARQASTVSEPYGLAIIAGLLISPHVLIHDLSLLLIPAVVAFMLRGRGPAHLPVLLAGGYAVSLLGLVVVQATPLQLTVPAMVALGLWSYHSVQRSSHSDFQPLPFPAGAVPSPDVSDHSA